MLLAADSKSAVIVPHGVTAGDWIHALVIMAVAITLCVLTRRLIGVVLGRPDLVVLRVIERLITYVLVTVGFLYALSALKVQIGPLLGALGIGGIALAFALQDTLQNLVAGVILQARRPFRRGDQVRIDKFEGVVEDVDLRNVALVTFDGLNVFLPNKTVLENPIVNYTRTPTRRTELTASVAFDTDLELAQRVLVEAAAGTPGIEASPPPAAWVVDFGESTVDFTLMFWHAFDRASVWKARSDVAMNVKTALDRAGIEMPFPQRGVWVHAGAEERDGRGASSGNGDLRRST